MLLLSIYYDLEEPSTILTRCLHDYGASTTLFWRLYPDCWRPWSCYDCFEHVQSKRGKIVELPDHEDSTAIILHLFEDSTTFLLLFVTIGHFDRSKSGVYVWTAGKSLKEVVIAHSQRARHQEARITGLSDIMHLKNGGLVSQQVWHVKNPGCLKP
jgi:hypothetical protein